MKNKNKKEKKNKKKSGKKEKYILEVKNLWKIYNPDSPKPVKALRGIDVKFKKGEFVALMGRSGSGKSTFLHQVALLDTPTKGEIKINGQKVYKMDEQEKAKFRLNFIGYIFQDYALLPELNLYENVALPLIAQGTDEEEYRKDVLDVIEKVGLKGLEKNLPGELSGGQQQRVSIARAIVNKPAILFADEPTANLDSESSEIVLKTMRKLVDDYGQTVIMVTHEEEDENIVDRTIWLKDGVLE